MFESLPQALVAVRGGDHVVALALESSRDERENIWLILTHEYARHATLPDRFAGSSLSRVNSVRQRDQLHHDAAVLSVVSLIQRLRDAPRPVYLGVIIGLATVTFALGLAALYLTPAGGTAAIWWPAAGTSALLALLYRGPRWQVFVLVAIVAAGSNLFIGRPPVFALWAMIILVAELLVFLLVLGPQGRGALLSTTLGLLRFIAASIAAATTVGLIGAASFVLLVGADPLLTFASLVPSHLSALLLIVPLVLVPMPRGLSKQRVELVIQAALTGTVTLLVFAPFQSEAIGALLFPFFGWAAVRFPPIVATAELVVLGAVGSVLTVLGGGPYAHEGPGLPAALLVQVYLLSIAITIQFIITVRSERAELRAENLRRASLLRGGFVGSQLGSTFARVLPSGDVRIVKANAMAESFIDPTWFDPFVAAWLESGTDDVSTEVLLDDGRTLQVYGRRLPAEDSDDVLGIQLVDISDFVAAQTAMAHAVERERRVADELRALAQQKDDFVSSVSHELRTPITSIVGFAEELDETATARQKEFTTIILRNANRLGAMVEELLELGRMTARNPAHERGTIELSTIAAEAVADQSPSARDRGVTIELVSPAEPSLVTGNATTFGRIATNLVANAIKFTPAGGHVRVSIAGDATEVHLAVDDSGPGISEEDAPRVFERFFRSADPQKLQAPGTGLGLSIVRALVDLLDGTIGVERSDLGGARLLVVLPRATAGEPSEAQEQPAG
ncbi:hypothetical protein GCM10009766_08660 [Microcella frigidaquae]